MQRSEYAEKRDAAWGDKIATSRQDAELVAAFLAKGGKVTVRKERIRSPVRREVLYAVRRMKPDGKVEYIAARLPVIRNSIIPKKGGVIKLCASRSHG